MLSAVFLHFFLHLFWKLTLLREVQQRGGGLNALPATNQECWSAEGALTTTNGLVSSFLHPLPDCWGKVWWSLYDHSQWPCLIISSSTTGLSREIELVPLCRLSKASTPNELSTKAHTIHLVVCTWLLPTHEDWLADWLDMKLPANVLKLFNSIRNPLTATRRDSVCLQHRHYMSVTQSAQPSMMNNHCYIFIHNRNHKQRLIIHHAVCFVNITQQILLESLSRITTSLSVPWHWCLGERKGRWPQNFWCSNPQTFWCRWTPTWSRLI